jgi:hypothetical protein
MTVVAGQDLLRGAFLTGFGRLEADTVEQRVVRSVRVELFRVGHAVVVAVEDSVVIGAQADAALNGFAVHRDVLQVADRI